MRKLWLTFTAMLLCSIASFAQTSPIEIYDAEDFKAIQAEGDYLLMADINLGTYDSTSNEFIIENFAGTFDGNDHTITYQGSFTANNEGQKVALFQTNYGTITNLNLDANITVGGTGQKVKVGLLCGENNGTITFCDVTGNINSTANSGSVGNASTGLIIGNNKKTLQYCTGHGNVTGVGYVGGLVGSMGTIMESSNDGYIKGCYFTGNVTANNSNTLNIPEIGLELLSFGGGICGIAFSPAEIELCVAEAVIVVGQNAGGISTTGCALWGALNYSTASNNYCTGEVIKNGESSAIDSNGEIIDVAIKFLTGSWNSNPPNYAGNNYCSEDPADVVDNLNQAKNDENFYFEEINGKVVLIVGKKITYICEAPKNLIVTAGENGTFTASWSVNNQDNTVNETTFRCSLTNNGETIQSGTTTATTLSGTLGASDYPYILTIESDCSASQNGLYSDAISYTFYVDTICSSVTGLEVDNVDPTTVVVTWAGSTDPSIVKLNGEVIELTNGGTIDGLTPGTEYTIEAIVNCTRHEGQTEIPYEISTTVTFITAATDYVTAQSGPFSTASTWVGGKVPTGLAGTTITIRDEHRVRLDGTLVLCGTIINKGVLVIPQSGQLINMTENNDLGIVEIVSGNKNNGEWTFIGAPFGGDEDDNKLYKLETIVPVPGNDADGISDISVKKYDYGTEENPTPGWSNSWAHIDTEMKAGEGYFGYPFYGGVVTFTTYGDVCTWDEQNSRYVIGSYDFDKSPVTELNNGDVTITETISATQDDPETIGVSEAGNWMALSNPYPAKLKASKFVSDNGGNAVINGNCVYVFKNGAFDMPSNDEIAMTEGFFVNFSSTGEKTITFNKGQLSYNNQSKASANEFIKLTLINGDKKVRAYLAHNENAEQGYDIFDANKLFAPTEIAEPYFVTDGVALMKEEFAELPYYATMNVRSFANDTVSFVVNNIPEGLAVSIIDGENVIDMVEGGVYTTEILTGENADRFKVLIKKNLGIADVEELEVNITNNNRHISISTTETDLQVEVYNALGQKVLSTKDRNFTLNQVSAGAYLIKAFNNKASKTQKIVVE